MNFAIVGLGGLGKLHFNNVAEVTKRVNDIKLVAICDATEKAFCMQTSTNLGGEDTDLDFSAYHLYTDVAELLEKEDLDFIITALPTYLHEKVAVMAMERGIHVFSEKPMALTVDEAENMLKVAKANHVKLMIGQCVRYFPEYVLLKDLIGSNEYGKVVRADFHRISPNVTWSWKNWMLDDTKSGGAALDLHVHDVDFIQWAFGMPKSVTSVATNHKTAYESINSIYHYDDMLVTAIGDWGMPGCYPFTAGYTVRFEKATVELTSGGVKLYPEEGEARLLEVPAQNGYVEEVVDFINCIREDRQSIVNPPESSCCSLRIARTEMVSADIGKTVAIS